MSASSVRARLTRLTVGAAALLAVSGVANAFTVTDLSVTNSKPTMETIYRPSVDAPKIDDVYWRGGWGWRGGGWGWRGGWGYRPWGWGWGPFAAGAVVGAAVAAPYYYGGWPYYYGGCWRRVWGPWGWRWARFC